MSQPRVAFFLGSASDGPIAKKGLAILDELGIPWELHVASAHRTPVRLEQLVKASPADVLVGIAGVAAALPGVLAALTPRPVIGVPVAGKVPFDSLLSIAQMPPGIPVATMGVDRGDNAALMAAAMLSIGDDSIKQAIVAYRKRQADKVVASDAKLKEELAVELSA